MVHRMHCYIDLQYPTWVRGGSRPPAPITFAPTFVKSRAPSQSKTGSVTIAWDLPLNFNGGKSDEGLWCDQCGWKGAIVQHAVAANATHSGGAFNGPHVAVGAPDAKCDSMDGYMPAKLAEGEVATIDLQLAKAVMPAMVELHLPTVSEGTMTVDAITTRGTSVRLFSGEAVGDSSDDSCEGDRNVYDARGLSFDAPMKTVRVSVRNTFTAIDAITVISRDGSAPCVGCAAPTFIVTRDPQFDGGGAAETTEITYTDNTLRSGVETYSYTVATKGRFGTSRASPAAKYSPKLGRCGDGSVGAKEQCDDANGQSGDGCSSTCTVEPTYACGRVKTEYKCYGETLPWLA